MSYSHKHYVIQLILLVSWLVFVSLTYSSTVQSQVFTMLNLVAGRGTCFWLWIAS